MKRIRVGVLAGGASAEREISLASGKMIADHLPRDRYEVQVLDTLALMAHNPKLPPEMRRRAGELIAGRSSDEALEERDLSLPGAFQDQIRQAASGAGPATELLAPGRAGPGIDVAFLAVHGAYGEDGRIQGMLDILGIPYTGSGTLSSAMAMDKVVSKRLFESAGIPTPRGIVVARRDFLADAQGVAARASSKLPAVVKPAGQGSSIGMSLVSRPESMEAALREAFGYDRSVLVEERVLGTEITVGVLGNRQPQALPVVEIVPKREFFDYRAKYDPALSEEICPARIPASAALAAQELALRSHAALLCRGFSRVDMIVGEQGIVVLEVNTLPGMTVNSLLPKAARAAGLSFGELLDRIVQLALEEEE